MLLKPLKIAKKYKKSLKKAPFEGFLCVFNRLVQIPTDNS